MNTNKDLYAKKIKWLKEEIFSAKRFSYQILLKPEYVNETLQLNFLYEDLKALMGTLSQK